MATITKPIVLDETVKECNRNLINVLENMTKASESAEKAEYAKDISVSVLNSIRDLDVGETLGQGVLNNITELNKAIAAYDSKNNVVYNLFDKDAVTTGGFYNSYGAWTSNAAYCETDFIPCVANEKIAVYNYSKYNQALNYYRSDKTRIALNGNSTGNEPYFTVPDNADIRYVRIALSNSAVNTFTIVRGDTPPTKYYPFGRNFDLLTSLENDTNRAMKYKQLYSTDAEKYGGLISNFENMTMYYTSSSFFTDAPLSVGAACVTTLRSSGTVGTVDGWQEALYPNLKRKFIRYIVAGEFSTWNEIKIMEGKSVYGRYIAFGDSLSVGQMWNEGADGQTVITICPEESKIPTRIAVAAGCQSDYENISKGGAGFLWSETSSLEGNM